MQVHLNNNANPVAFAGPQKPPVRAPDTGPSPGPQFQAAQALNGALIQLPDARPEVVERAKSLIHDPEYPPMEAIRKISSLLAMNLSDLPEVTSPQGK